MSTKVLQCFVVSLFLFWGSQSVLATSNVDPWESLNRKSFRFNEVFDTWFLKPTATTYDQYMPGPAKTGVNRFIKNTENVVIGVNNFLQLKWVEGSQDFLRFTVNLTLGFLGLFDVATLVGLPVHDEDFGQTLGYWGVPSGPYVMLPFLGASTLRDSISRPFDTQLRGSGFIDHIPTKNTHFALWVLDLRVELFEYEEMIIGEPYNFIRDAYLQSREFKVKDGAVEDEFIDDDWE